MALKLVHPPRDAAIGIDDGAETVLTALDALRAHMHRLVELSEIKLEALRAADTAALNACAFEESAVLRRMADEEPRREAAIARLAQIVPDTGGVKRTLSALAAELPEPWSSRLAAKAAGLRPAVEALHEKNQKVSRVARSLQGHLRAVVTEVARANQETVGYGRDGQADQRVTRTWVDAVG